MLGGPSGVGKTSVSYRLAHHFGIGITEVDDFQVILERMTTPTEQPVLHYWRTHPEAANQPVEILLNQAASLPPFLNGLQQVHDLEQYAPDPGRLVRRVLASSLSIQERCASLSTFIDQVLEPIGGRLQEWSSSPQVLEERAE